MLGKIFTLIGLWAMCLNLWAISNEELLNNLRGRLKKLPHHQGKLIKSFTNHTQSYVYDQALAIMAFSHERDQKNARELLLGLQSLQMKDGSLYFSYYMDGKSPYPNEEGDKKFAGAVAWVAMAAVHYQKVFHSKEFVKFNAKVLRYLDSQMKPFQDTRALVFNHKDVPGTKWDESETVALEHNLDAYAAFSEFAKLNPRSPWKKNPEQIKKFILSMWDSSRMHFWSGGNTKTGGINKEEIYLDNQSWSLLALDQQTLKKLDTDEALTLNCETLYVEHEGVKGFMDSKPTRRPASSQFVWSEGTAGHLLAMNKVGHKECRGMKPQDFVSSIKKMKKADGGIAYSTTTPNPDFNTASSVAGTAWLYFASKNFNPFQFN